MKLYYDAAYGLLFICAGLGIGYFDAYEPRDYRVVFFTQKDEMNMSSSRLRF